jgi:hypothetical protein
MVHHKFLTPFLICDATLKRPLINYTTPAFIDLTLAQKKLMSKRSELDIEIIAKLFISSSTF